MNVTEAAKRLRKFAKWAKESNLPRISHRAEILASGITISANKQKVKEMEALSKELQARVKQAFESQERWMAPENLHQEKLADQAKRNNDEGKRERQRLYMQVWRAKQKRLRENPPKPMTQKEIEEQQEQQVLNDMEAKAINVSELEVKAAFKKR